jgi:hypothetical protein
MQGLLARRKPLLSQELQHYPNLTMTASGSKAVSPTSEQPDAKSPTGVLSPRLFLKPLARQGVFSSATYDTNQTGINTTEEDQP